MSDINSEIAEPSPGPSGSSETQQADPEDRNLDDADDRLQWPTVTDLNTRLRRVITSYQRSYRKEEQKMAAAKAKVCYFAQLYFLFDKIVLIFKCMICALIAVYAFSRRLCGHVCSLEFHSINFEDMFTVYSYYCYYYRMRK